MPDRIRRRYRRDPKGFPRNFLAVNTLIQERGVKFWLITTKGFRATLEMDSIYKMDINDLDVDFLFSPMRGLELDGCLGITDKNIKDNMSAAPSTISNHTPNSSSWKLTLGPQYADSVRIGMSEYGYFDLEERGKKYWYCDDSHVSEKFAMLGIGPDVRDKKESWPVYLYGQNLTDKKCHEDVNYCVANGWSYAVLDAKGSLAQRRAVGVETNFKLQVLTKSMVLRDATAVLRIVSGALLNYGTLFYHAACHSPLQES